MPATATRMQLIVPTASHVGAKIPIRKTPRAATFRDSAPPDQAFDLGSPDGLLPEIAVNETDSVLNLSIPLRGVDARTVYVIASARSITVEVRIINAICRTGFIHKELQQQRITRELRFRENIVKGSTIVRYFGGDLEIRCVKGHCEDESAWSELVTLDTRSSLGSVG